MPEIITVKKGDCFINICKQKGFFWETVWNHPENKEIRQKRKKLNILKKGDQIYFPDLEIKEVSAITEQTHHFVVKGAPVKFTLTLLNLGQPRAKEDYILKVDGFTRATGTTDKTGTLTEMIPPTARHGLLLLGKNKEQIQINFGYVDPIEEISGVQTRLQNLGFYEGDIDDQLNTETIVAIAEFQRSVDLHGQGELNDETKQKLIEVHGS